jgi:hypothetical protein
LNSRSPITNPRSLTTLVAVALLVALQAVVSARQAPDTGVYETYRAAVSAYTKTGDITSAVIPLQYWSPKEFDVATKATIASKNAEALRAAAVFHLEIGVAVVGLSAGAAAGHFKYGSDLLTRWTAARPFFSASGGEEEKTTGMAWQAAHLRQ